MEDWKFGRYENYNFPSDRVVSEHDVILRYLCLKNGNYSFKREKIKIYNVMVKELKKLQLELHPNSSLMSDNGIRTKVATLIQTAFHNDSYYKSRYKNDASWIAKKLKTHEAIFNIENVSKKRKLVSLEVDFVELSVENEPQNELEENQSPEDPLDLKDPPKRIYLPEPNDHDYYRLDYRLWKENEKYIDYMENKLTNLENQLKTFFQKFTETEQLSEKKERENYSPDPYYTGAEYNSVMSEILGSNDSESSDIEEDDEEDGEYDPFLHGHVNCTFDWSVAASYGYSQNISERQIYKFICSVLRNLEVMDPQMYPSRKYIHDTILRECHNINAKVKEENTGLYCLEFDGKQDNQLMKYNKRKKIEHISIISQPGDIFIDVFRYGFT